MSAATVFPEPEIPTPPENPEPDPTSNPASWWETVLGLLAEGASVAAAMRHVGYSSAAFYKACNRHPEFRAAAARARNGYRAQVAEEFHDAESYARILVDAVMRDEQLPASLRLRAALAILNRKGDHWLPTSIPVPEETVDTVDTVDVANFMDPSDAMDTVGTMDTVYPVDPLAPTNTVDAMDTVDNIEDLALRQISSEIEAMDSAFRSVLQSMRPSAPVSEAATPVDIMDNVGIMDNVDIAATVETASEAGRASNVPQSREPLTAAPRVSGSVAA